MKKILALILALAAAAVLVSCGGKDEGKNDPDSQNSAQTSDSAATSDQTQNPDNQRPEEQVPPSEGLTYEINGEKDGYIVTGTGTFNGTKLNIPTTYNELPVKEIGEYAFSQSTTLTSVMIPGSVNKIGSRAFHGCTALKSITISEGVAVISDSFMDCTALTSITIPNSVTYIAQRAFQGCKALASVTLPNSLNQIDRYKT